jgi:hypothetical protein
MPLDASIYLTETGYDGDLALLVEVLILLDAQCVRIAAEGNDPGRSDFTNLIDRWLPPVRICHPYPLRRLGVIT